MYKNIIPILIIITATAISAHAKRMPAPKVAPLLHEDLIIKADTEQMGIIQIYNTNHTLLWKKRIYKIRYKPGLERDVQDVFIKKMFMHLDLRLEKEILIIINEKNVYYSLDLNSKKVRKLKQKEIDVITGASQTVKY